jgi:hypothetical protein
LLLPVQKAGSYNQWKRLWIRNPGLHSIAEVRQAIWQDFSWLEETGGAHFIKDPLLCLPLANEYGDPLNLLRHNGEVIRRFHSHAYKSAAADFRL